MRFDNSFFLFFANVFFRKYFFSQSQFTFLYHDKHSDKPSQFAMPTTNCSTVLEDKKLLISTFTTISAWREPSFLDALFVKICFSSLNPWLKFRQLFSTLSLKKTKTSLLLFQIIVVLASKRSRLTQGQWFFIVDQRFFPLNMMNSLRR